MSILDLFRKRSATSSQAAKQKPAADAPAGNVSVQDAMAQFAARLADQLAGILRTEEDVWWFLAEEFDYIMERGEPAAGLLAMSSLKLHEIEYEGRKSENSYVGRSNPGVALLKKAKTVFTSKFDEDIADMTIAYAFIMFVENNINALRPLRIKYATHFHNNCVKQHAFRNADRWGEVLDSLQRG